MTAALSCVRVDKHFGATHALKNVSARFEAGQIHALLGQNGAGKSTLARVFSGLVEPETGTLEIQGQETPLGSSAACHDAGLDIVHQRFALPPTFTAAEALEFASARKLGGAFFGGAKLKAAWGARMAQAGITIDPGTKLVDVPVETAQALEILRALSNDAQVLILDEPTALLSPAAIQDLFDRLRELRDAGVTLIVILHKLREVMDIADTVSVLREGELVLPPTPRAELTTAQISDLMIGESFEQTELGPRTSPMGASVLEFKSVTTHRDGVEPGLRDVSLTLRAGEIMGVAGVEGNGQRALAQAIMGISPITNGAFSLKGQHGAGLRTSDLRARGIRAVPFDRMTEGSALDLPLWENICAWKASDFANGALPLVSLKAMHDHSETRLHDNGVVFGSVSDPISSLSGGNMQKVILAREFDGDVSVVVAAQPTRGLDFKATEFVWSELHRLRDQGAAVLLISSDLDELFGICDSLLVMRAGEVTGRFEAPYARRAVGDAMLGAAR